MDDPRYTHHVVANQLLSALGERMAAHDTLGLPMSLSTTLRNTGAISSSSAGEVTGGTPIMYAQSGEVTYERNMAFASGPPQHTPLPFGGDFTRAHPHNANVSRSVPADTMPYAAASVKRFGKGIVIAMATSSLFTDKEMGSNTAIPTAEMRKIYNLEYWIFQKGFDLRADTAGNK